MQRKQPYAKPSERALVRLTSHLNNAPPLADDSSSNRCLVGFFTVDGELASVRLGSIDDIDYNDARGVAVPVTSRTDSITDLERRWDRGLSNRQ